jgi:hypothetical protein
MSSVLHPVGSMPPRVYWTRRLLVVALVVVGLLVGAAILHLATGSGSGKAAALPSTTSTSAGPPQPCPASAIGLALAADAPTYAAGVNPTFTMTLTNTGAEPCTLDAGDAARQVVITSGADRIWASSDCVAAASAAKQVLLTPGQAYPSAVPWLRVRSAAGCPTGLPAPRPGTYQATATLGGVTTAPVVLKLG